MLIKIKNNKNRGKNKGKIVTIFPLKKKINAFIE